MLTKRMKTIISKLTKKVLEPVLELIYAFGWIFVTILAMSISVILFSLVITNLDLTLKILTISLSLGSFCFLAGSFLHKEKQNREMSKKFFELSVYFILSGIFLFFSYLALNEEPEGTCIGLRKDLPFCLQIKQAFGFIGFGGSVFLLVGMINLVRYLSKFAREG